MARKPYKLEEEKKDKAIHFRLPNVFYQLLKELSQEEKLGVNVFARKLLVEYLDSKYSRVEYTLRKLYAQRNNLQNLLMGFTSEAERLSAEISSSKKRLEKLETDIKKHREEIEKVSAEINAFIELLDYKSDDYIIKILNAIKKDNKILDQIVGDVI
jgi:predicted  nucleic acid-binding Zn-ribbon protein